MDKRICDVEGCENPHVARGACPKHYQRARRAGMPTLPDKFHRLSEITEDSATCAICGPVEIVSSPSIPRPRCRNKVLADGAEKRRRARLSDEKRERLNAYHRDYTRRRKYGIEERYGIEALLASVSHQCEICTRPLDVRTSRIDHDHACCSTANKTCGKCIRGILCNSCNTGLGLLGDTVSGLEAALRYLRGELRYPA